AHFLGVESCGQCAACKGDGLAIAEVLDASLATVADGARCNLAYQQQTVVGSILELFGDQVTQHREKHGAASTPTLIAAIHELADGHAVLDERQGAKQPDWTYDETYSGKWPADRLDDHRAHDTLE
ncbi:MAG: hypothetical protein ACXWAY_13280, partial [Acidimicrobiia bacterium]